MTCGKVMVLFSIKSREIYAYTTSVLKIIPIISLKDPKFQSIEPDFVEICKFPKQGKNMKREAYTSLVSKARAISLTTFERKSQSPASTQTRPIGKAAIHSPFSFANITKRLLIC